MLKDSSVLWFVKRDLRNVDAESVQAFRIFKSIISHWELQVFWACLLRSEIPLEDWLSNCTHSKCKLFRMISDSFFTLTLQRIWVVP